MGERGLLTPALAGIVASLVGFASTFALVLAGLRAVGADPAQAASGLLALCVLMGVVAIGLALRTRMPVAIAWSTPGAALLVSTGDVPGGYPAALGAFAVTGALIALCGLWRPLARWIARIPVPLAGAMLAGVVLPLCVAPVRAVVELPWQAAPVVAVWLALTLVARRWAVPGAMAATVAAIAVAGDLPGALDDPWPQATLTAPALDAGALVGLALPLFVVTMASQNVPGMAVMASFGYRPPLRPLLVSTGAATAAGAPFGAHAINLAAITAALIAGPEAGPDRERRWVAALSGGIAYLALGLAAGVATAVVAAAPPLLIEAAAGLALLATFGAALGGALAAGEHREAATITFVVSASGIAVAGIGAPFWGLAAGLGFLGVQRLGAARPARAGRGPAGAVEGTRTTEP
ncbi:MAG: benzoate/H(+) symporter BenE family transporter [Solirubrobacteraceae bacterium]|nr:benzoate/H(+) symporter BenE family transporter [Solirubrobacteraceae bacterium]